MTFTDLYMTRVYDGARIPFIIDTVTVEEHGDYSVRRAEHDDRAWFVFRGNECIATAGSLRIARRMLKRLAA
jgi:hypothetical protein